MHFIFLRWNNEETLKKKAQTNSAVHLTLYLYIFGIKSIEPPDEFNNIIYEQPNFGRIFCTGLRLFFKVYVAHSEKSKLFIGIR